MSIVQHEAHAATLAVSRWGAHSTIILLLLFLLYLLSSTRHKRTQPAEQREWFVVCLVSVWCVWCVCVCALAKRGDARRASKVWCTLVLFDAARAICVCVCVFCNEWLRSAFMHIAERACLLINFMVVPAVMRAYSVHHTDRRPNKRV